MSEHIIARAVVRCNEIVEREPYAALVGIIGGGGVSAVIVEDVDSLGITTQSDLDTLEEKTGQPVNRNLPAGDIAEMVGVTFGTMGVATFACVAIANFARRKITSYKDKRAAVL